MLEVSEITKTYEGKPLLKGVSFTVAEGETICLLGASGSGKSTLLRIIAGLEQAESGRVCWDGEDLAGVPVHLRQFGLMFQDYALFPHRNVAENVAFGLRMQGLPREAIDLRVADALRQVNLARFGRRRVTDLSGGEQQRVALARALAPRPRLVMLDEPLGALDRALREQLIEEIRRVLHESGVPAIYVTHDQEEAFTVADRLVLLHDGQVAQTGTPAEVFTRPTSPWAARFLGLSNLVSGELVSQQPPQVRTPLGVFTLPGSAERPGQKVTLLLRPLAARPAGADEVENVLSGVVQDVIFHGESFRVELACAGGVELAFQLPQAPQKSETLRLAVDPGGIVCLSE